MAATWQACCSFVLLTLNELTIILFLLYRGIEQISSYRAETNSVLDGRILIRQNLIALLDFRFPSVLDKKKLY